MNEKLKLLKSDQFTFLTLKTIVKERSAYFKFTVVSPGYAKMMENRARCKIGIRIQ